MLIQIEQGGIEPSMYNDDPRLFTDFDAMQHELSIADGKLIKEFADVMIVTSNLAESIGYSISFREEVQTEMFDTVAIFDRVGVLFETFGKISASSGIYDFELGSEHLVNVIKKELRVFNLMLLELAKILHVEIQTAVNMKMNINRNREWNIGLDGTGSHIKKEQ